MEKITVGIEGLLLFNPKIFKDERGEFFETYNYERYASQLPGVNFVQDNLSKSHKNVLRGLHFQLPPFDQGKLVQVIKGRALDVAVDIRKNSKTYGHYFSVELSEINKIQFWIPPGFAHGFLSLENDTLFAYKCTNNYSPGHEKTILWNDSQLAIDWKETEPIVSSKDTQGIQFSDFNSPF
jgi:dTDP-4-dehydrorhamnose 3,5-epimerase